MECSTEQPNKYARNHRPAGLYEFRGQPMTMDQVASELGVSVSCVSRRLRGGAPLDAPPKKSGRPPETVTLTRAELAEILGVTPKAVSKRIKRGQLLTAPKRYGLVRDVTDEPKRKPAESVDPVKARRDAIDGIIERTKEPGNLLDQRAQLEAAWDAGHNTGARR